MFVWTTSLPSLPLRIRTTKEPVDRSAPAPASEPKLDDAAQPPSSPTARDQDSGRP